MEVLSPGKQNHGGGPDFSDATVKIDRIKWVGKVEIHKKASDWFLHGHHKDPAYNSVVLHVVLENDAEATTSEGVVMPTLVLKVSDEVVRKITDLDIRSDHLRCLPEVEDVIRIQWRAIQERLLIERLEHRRLYIEEIGQGADWDQRLYTMLLRYLGMGYNNDAFVLLAQSLPISFLRKHANNTLALEAMLLGQAGLLTDPKDEYAQKLQTEYQFYALKFGLKPIKDGLIRFMRLRPAVFPTRMLAIAAALLKDHKQLTSLFHKDMSVEKMHKILSAEPSDYFCNHYHFGSPAGKKLKGLGEETRNSLIINVFIPILWSYYRSLGENSIHHERLPDILALYEDLPFEDNRLTRLFSTTEAVREDAGYSQALIELYKRYCTEGRCMKCAIAPKLFGH